MQPALRRGDPEEVIPVFVVAEGIDLVVMGTVARAGHFGNADRQHGGASTQEVAVFRPDREAGWIRESCAARGPRLALCAQWSGPRRHRDRGGRTPSLISARTSVEAGSDAVTRSAG